MIRTVLAVAAIVLGVTSVAAQDPIATRKETMKGVGAQTKIASDIAKGAQPYTQDAATKVFATYAAAAAKMPSLFPDNSKTGGETTAGPKIWEDMAGFKAGFAKLETDAKAAQASVKDLDSFKVAFGNITKNCGACHEVYRIKK